jgi:hypothetical protein
MRVVRFAETVRRPPQTYSELVHALLENLAALHLDIAPCYLGTDSQRREILSYLNVNVSTIIDLSGPTRKRPALLGVLAVLWAVSGRRLRRAVRSRRGRRSAE